MRALEAFKNVKSKKFVYKSAIRVLKKEKLKAGF
jgi:hypothetical protein